MVTRLTAPGFGETGGSLGPYNSSQTTASVARMSEATSGIPIHPACRFAHAGYLLPSGLALIGSTVECTVVQSSTVTVIPSS